MLSLLPALNQLGSKAVLLKGGHLQQGSECIDLLFNEGQLHQFTSPRIHTHNTHGTGCTLSSAITAELAKGATLPASVANAKEWLSGAIAASSQLNIGQGHGPVHHFYQLWQ
jgi:hydroxymethylpyrimidine/phosphomethylpyrimidine kinase